MSAASPALPVATDETSPRYAGWRVVAACFIVAVFCWGFGLDGHGVYLVELQRLHGWPASLIASAASAYYLSAPRWSSSSATRSRGSARAAVVLAGAACMGSAVTLLAFITAPWQLFAAYLILATGAAAMHTGAITTIVGLWFDRQRGLAISLALNGASFGGILVTPALVIAIEAVGFQTAMVGAAAIMAMAVLPAAVLWIDRPPARSQASPQDRPAGRMDARQRAAQRGLLERRRAVRGGADGADRLHRAPDRVPGAGDGPSPRRVWRSAS